MNLPTLHPGLSSLLEASGIDNEYPKLVYFSSYSSGNLNIQGGEILCLEKFKLFNPESPIIFFSLLPITEVHSSDVNGVFKLENVGILQLPIKKEELFYLCKSLSSTPLSKATWNSFSEKVCKKLIKDRIREISHGGKDPIGNEVLNPIRLTSTSMLSYKHLEENFREILFGNFILLNKYLKNPTIKELLDWCCICHDSENEYLKNCYLFSKKLKQLALLDQEIDPMKIISKIDSINSVFMKLQT